MCGLSVCKVQLFIYGIGGVRPLGKCSVAGASHSLSHRVAHKHGAAAKGKQRNDTHCAACIVSEGKQQHRIE